MASQWDYFKVKMSQFQTPFLLTKCQMGCLAMYSCNDRNIQKHKRRASLMQMFSVSFFYHKFSLTKNQCSLWSCRLRVKNCSFLTERKCFANSRPSALNFKSFSQSLEHFFSSIMLEQFWKQNIIFAVYWEAWQWKIQTAFKKSWNAWGVWLSYLGRASFWLTKADVSMWHEKLSFWSFQNSRVQLCHSFISVHEEFYSRILSSSLCPTIQFWHIW